MIMEKKILWFSVALILMFGSIGYTGDFNTSQPGSLGERWEFFGHHDWLEKSRPYMEINYGENLPAIKDFHTSFARIGYGEIKLGYRTLEKNPSKLDDNYFYLNQYSKSLKDFNEAEEANKIKAKMLSFGMGHRNAYGYEFSAVSIYPYHQLRFGWTKFEADTPAVLAMFESDKLARIEGKYRFGGSAEAGIDLSLYKSVSLIAGYEVAVVYPRFLFWKWLGGSLIQGIGLEAVTQFAEEIVDLSPTFGPIMFAALRAGTSYLIYNGMKSKMYWPINSEAPLTHETAKVGVAIRF